MKEISEKRGKKRWILPNYTQVPNRLLAGMKEFKVPEFYILLFICRETFGFHRKKAVLSINRISRNTGICRRAVIYALHRLEGTGYIERRAAGRSFSYQLRFSSVENRVREEEESYL